MNKHQIDRLFEEKLGAVQQEPTDKAKARFDQLLAQKHKKPVLIWWRVAAAILLLGVSTVTYLSWPAGEEQPLTADLPENNTAVPLANNTDPSEASTETQESIPDEESNRARVEAEAKIAKLPVAAPMLAENTETVEEVAQTTQEVSTAPDGTDIADATSIAVAENEEREPQVAQDLGSEEISIEQLEEAITTEVAITANEAPAEEAPKKKRLPVTIIYKSSSADQSLVAMQEIRNDVDSLSDGSENSLKSILQSAGDGSLIAELKKAKEDLFNLDIPLKSKKVNN